MATRVIDDTKLQNIAVAIQGKDSGGTMTVDEMPTRIAAIQTGDEVLFSSYGRQYTRTVEIPDGVIVLGSFAFENCRGLTNITFPDRLTTIDQYGFDGCTGLTEIDLKNVTTIGQAAFRNCTGLTNITFPDSLTTIIQYAFQNCTGLTNIDLKNVTTIGRFAFNGCPRLSLIDLTSRATPTTLDNTNSFSYTNNTWIAVVANDTIKSDFQNATNWSTFASHFRTIAEVEAEVGMTYDEYYYQLFGEPRNEVTP